jgi:hypothetical protein
VSSKEIIKEMPIPGKGHNETLEIVDPLEPTAMTVATVKEHVSENGGTSVVNSR